MSDQDFNFNPPPRREPKKPFEPPPWEQEQFEDLARRREQQRASQEPLMTDAGIEAVAEEPIGPASQEAPAVAPQPTGAGAPGEPPADTPKRKVPAEDDPRVEAMMAVLRSEEPAFGAEMWKGSVAAGFVLALVGVVLVVWGVFAASVAKRTGMLGLLGGGILVVFGLLFTGVGVWLVYRTLRQRGVL